MNIRMMINAFILTTPDDFFAMYMYIKNFLSMVLG